MYSFAPTHGTTYGIMGVSLLLQSVMYFVERCLCAEKKIGIINVGVL